MPWQPRDIAQNPRPLQDWDWNVQQLDIDWTYYALLGALAAGVPLLQLDAALGRIGIGTASPDALLHVNGAGHLGSLTLDTGLAAASIAANAITTAKILDAAVTNAKLATPCVRVYQETVGFAAFTDGGGASGTYNLATTIPAGARFLNSLVTGITGFTGDVSAALIIGDGTDTDRYNTGTPSVFTTAAQGVDLGVPSGTAWHTAAKTPVLTITSSSDWGLVVAGALTVTLFYLAP